MKPVQSLPESYVLAWDVNMKRDRRLNWILQIVGLFWMAAAGWLLAIFMAWMRPDFYGLLQVRSSFNLLVDLLLVLVIMVITIIFHELVHGLFFWLFAGRPPRFGIGEGYAYAGLPDWFFQKKQYLVIGIAPLAVLTILGLTWGIFAPLTWLGWIFTGVVINAGGAIGDLYVCWRIAREAEDVWVKDTGDGFEVYRRRLE